MVYIILVENTHFLFYLLLVALFMCHHPGSSDLIDSILLCRTNPLHVLLLPGSYIFNNLCPVYQPSVLLCFNCSTLAVPLTYSFVVLSILVIVNGNLSIFN